MVVRFAAVARRCARRACRTLPGRAVLLAGIAVLPGQSNDVLPGLQMHAIEQLAGGSQASAIAPSSSDPSAAPIGSPDPTTSAAFGWRGFGLPEPPDAEPGDGTASSGADAPALGSGGPVQIIGGMARDGIHAVCGDDEPGKQMQAGGAFWPAHAGDAAPVTFPQGVFMGSPFTIDNASDDPTLGPGGDRSNLTAPGPAGAWCRPAPEPFARSSPLASRAFWIPLGVLLVGTVIFWLTRGFRIPETPHRLVQAPVLARRRQPWRG